MRPRRRRTAWTFALLIAGSSALAGTGTGCGCIRSTVNSSESLRWFLFSSFGASRVCPEMQKRGVPIRIDALGGASMGRFFADECQATVNQQSHTLSLTFKGSGYASLPAVRRVGFAASVGVELSPDFRLEEDATYVWGRFRTLLFPPDVRLLGVENSMANAAAQTPLGSAANLLGTAIVASELARGFTVVQQDSGDDFALGLLQPPAKPPRDFEPGKGRVLLASEQVQVAAAARAYLGPFDVPSNGAALYVRMRMDGPQLVYGLLDRAAGDAWRRQYQQATPLGPPPVPPMTTGYVPPGETKLVFPVQRGSYYLVVENRSAVPVVSLGLPMPIGGEPLSYLTYGVELGDRP